VNPNSRHRPTPVVKPLNAIMRLDKLRDATGDEIAALWKAYHFEQRGVGAVITADVYSKMRRRTKECPMFILPVRSILFLCPARALGVLNHLAVHTLPSSVFLLV